VTTLAPPASAKYAERFCDWLVELGYTHCFFVAGGNIMHLLDGARTRFVCIAVVHEVAAGIAAEYFNESGGTGRAFALVTAGPGVTNILTAMAGAWLESRELLVIGGQVKSGDLAGDALRQRGIQEIDGRALAAPIAVRSVRMERPWSKRDACDAVLAGTRGRPGPVFIEMCLDAQAVPTEPDLAAAPLFASSIRATAVASARAAAPRVAALVAQAKRPIWLLGGGVSRAAARDVRVRLAAIGIPVMTTWNGADRVDARDAYVFGRPNTWGQRHANVIMHQADCIVALGSRLGLQQTGFNWREFGRHAVVVHCDLDRAELEKGHPRVDLPIAGDADTLLRELAAGTYPDQAEWRAYCREVAELLPIADPMNVTRPGYLSPYAFYRSLSALARAEDILIPCSSGGANSTAMQAIEQKFGQIVVTDKGLASMGYGLSGAIGAALAHPDRRTVLVEGDGGFMQNLQELATVAVRGLDVKIFIFANEGYGSIRMTQKNYFGGAYLGCDTRTGLGFPQWPQLFAAFGIPCIALDADGLDAPGARAAFRTPGPQAFVVPIDPEQTYFPKIASRVTADGSMESAPLHLMTPELSPDLARRVFRFVDP